MKIAVLFDGAGLARLGLEQAGHDCTGYEIDPAKHHLSTQIGSGKCVCTDVLKVEVGNFFKYDAIWASPPCQYRSGARPNTSPSSSTNLLNWCISLCRFITALKPDYPFWIENVTTSTSARGGNDWGTIYNAAQFLQVPIQNRNRIIGGNYKAPKVFHNYKRVFKGICPCITATEYKARTKNAEKDRARASRWYKRKLTIEECAYHQGLTIPHCWYTPMSGFTQAQWNKNIYEAIGNGVPVYMAKAFGDMY